MRGRRVHADRLLERGDPYGELVALACGLANEASLAGVLRERVEALFGTGVRMGWHEGWVDALDLEGRHDVLEHLTSEGELGGLTTLRWSGPVDRRLAEWILAEGEHLEVVEIRGGGALDVPLDALFGGSSLRSLTLDLPTVVVDGSLELPALEVLDVWTARPPVEVLAGSRLPALRSLRLGGEAIDEDAMEAWRNRSLDELVLRQALVGCLGRVEIPRVRERLVVAGWVDRSMARAAGRLDDAEVVVESWSAAQQELLTDVLGREVRRSRTWPVGLEHEVGRQLRRRSFGSQHRLRTLRRDGRMVFVGDGSGELDRAFADPWAAAFEHALRRRTLEGLGWDEDDPRDRPPLS